MAYSVFKVPLNPNQPTNQPSVTLRVVRGHGYQAEAWQLLKVVNISDLNFHNSWWLSINVAPDFLLELEILQILHNVQ